MIYLAQLNTSSFDFVAVGKTPFHARRALLTTLRKHCNSYGVDFRTMLKNYNDAILVFQLDMNTGVAGYDIENI